MEDNKYPAIFATPKGAMYTVNISQVFGDAYTFDEVVHLLTTASPDDSFNIVINSDGGNLFSLIALRNAIRSSQAQIHMNLLGIGASAGSALFLETAHSYQVHDNSCLMIHNMLCGTGFDDTQKIRTRAEYNMKMNERFVRETYQDFLTEDEIYDVIFNSREIYLEDVEIRQRLEQREALKQQRFAEGLQETLSSPPDLSKYTEEELQEELEAIDEDLKTFQQDKKTIREELKKRSKSVVVGEQSSDGKPKKMSATKTTKKVDGE